MSDEHKKYEHLAAGMDPARRERGEAKAYEELIEEDLREIAKMSPGELALALAGRSRDELAAIHDATQRVLRRKSN